MDKDATRTTKSAATASVARGRRQQRKLPLASLSNTHGSKTGENRGGDDGVERPSLRERVAELEAQKLELEYDARKRHLPLEDTLMYSVNTALLTIDKRPVLDEANAVKDMFLVPFLPEDLRAPGAVPSAVRCATVDLGERLLPLSFSRFWSTVVFNTKLFPMFCPRPSDALFDERPVDPDVAELCRLVVRFFQRLAATVDGAEFISQPYYGYLTSQGLWTPARVVGFLAAFGLTAAPHLNQLLSSMFGGMGQGAEEELLRAIIGLAHDGLATSTDDVRDAARFRLDLLSALNALFKGYPPSSHLAVAAGSLVKLADTYDFFCANFAGTRIGNAARGLIQATCADIIGHGVIGALQHDCSRLLCPYRTHPSLRSASTALLDFIEYGERQSKASPGRENVVVRVAEQISLDKLMERCRFTCPAPRVAAALGFLAAAGVSSGALPDPTEQIYKVPTSVSVGKSNGGYQTQMSDEMKRLIVERYDLYNDEYDDTLDDGETFLGKRDVESSSDDDDVDDDGQNTTASKSRVKWRRAVAGYTSGTRVQQQQQQQQRHEQNEKRNTDRLSRQRGSGGANRNRDGSSDERVHGRLTGDAQEFVPKRVSIVRPQRHDTASGERDGKTPRGGRDGRGGMKRGGRGRARGKRQEARVDL